jgi:hypothetical protein
MSPSSTSRQEELPSKSDYAGIEQNEASYIEHINALRRYPSPDKTLLPFAC